MMSLLPNTHTAFIATASAMGPASARSAAASASIIWARVAARLSGVRPPKKSPSWRRTRARALSGVSNPATVLTT